MGDSQYHAKTEQSKRPAPQRQPQASKNSDPKPPISALELQAALANPQAARPETILQLQRMVGNRAVTDLLQRKVAVEPAPDQGHHQADRSPQPVSSRSAELIHAAPPTGTVQRRGGRKKKGGQGRGGGQRQQPPTTPQPSTPTNQPQSQVVSQWQTYQNALIQGITAFINSAKLEFNSDNIIKWLTMGLVEKLKAEVSSESLKVELEGLKIPLMGLANLDLAAKGEAKLQDEGLLAKIQEGVAPEDLVDHLTGAKQLDEKMRENLPDIGIKGGFSPTKFGRELISGPDFKAKKAEGKLALSGSLSSKLKLGFDWITNLVKTFIGNPFHQVELFIKDQLLNSKEPSTEGLGGQVGSWLGGGLISGVKSIGSGIGSALNWATLGYGSSLVSGVKSVGSWLDWVTGGYAGSALNWFTGWTRDGIMAWLQERLEFLKKVDYDSLLSLGGSVEGDGDYKGYGQVENLDLDFSVDMEAPENYLSTWAKELLPKDGWFETIANALGGKLKVFSVKGLNFSRAKGLRGILSKALSDTFEMGHALPHLGRLLISTVKLIKRGIKQFIPSTRNNP